MERAYGPHQCCGAIFIMAFVSLGVELVLFEHARGRGHANANCLSGTNRPSEAYARLFSGNKVSCDYIYK